MIAFCHFPFNCHICHPYLLHISLIDNGTGVKSCISLFDTRFSVLLNIFYYLMKNEYFVIVNRFSTLINGIFLWCLSKYGILITILCFTSSLQWRISTQTQLVSVCTHSLFLCGGEPACAMSLGAGNLALRLANKRATSGGVQFFILRILYHADICHVD